MARLGFRTFNEMIGQTDKMFFNPDKNNEKATKLNFGPILTKATELNPEASTAGGTMKQDFNMDARLVGIVIPSLRLKNMCVKFGSNICLCECDCLFV